MFVFYFVFCLFVFVFAVVVLNDASSCQGRSQLLTPEWARYEHFLNLSSFSCSFFLFSSIFLHFLPHFGLLGGQLAHPGRPWLHHWFLHSFSDSYRRTIPGVGKLCHWWQYRFHIRSSLGMEFTFCGHKICHNYIPVQVKVKNPFVYERFFFFFCLFAIVCRPTVVFYCKRHVVSCGELRP